MLRTSKLLLVCAALGLALGACSQSTPEAPSTDSNVALAIGALDLASVDSAIYRVTLDHLEDQSSPTDGIGDAWVVITDSNTTSDPNGRGSATMVIPCVASDTAINRVTVQLTSYVSEGETITEDLPPAQTKEFECLENQDVRLAFDFVVLQDAVQGFVDLAINLGAVRCAAKVDCVEDLEFDAEGDRGLTIVTGFACAGDGEQHPDQHLAYYSEICCFGTDTTNPSCTHYGDWSPASGRDTDPANNPGVVSVSGDKGAHTSNGLYENTKWRMDEAWLAIDGNYCELSSVGWLTPTNSNGTPPEQTGDMRSYPGDGYPIVRWTKRIGGDADDDNVTDCEGGASAQYGSTCFPEPTTYEPLAVGSCQNGLGQDVPDFQIGDARHEPVVCPDCASGGVTIFVPVGNLGAAEGTAALELGSQDGITVVASKDVTLPARTATHVEFFIPTTDWEGLPDGVLYATIDRLNAVEECEETNNAPVSISTSPCAEPTCRTPNVPDDHPSGTGFLASDEQVANAADADDCCNYEFICPSNDLLTTRATCVDNVDPSADRIVDMYGDICCYDAASDDTHCTAYGNYDPADGSGSGRDTDPANNPALASTSGGYTSDPGAAGHETSWAFAPGFLTTPGNFCQFTAQSWLVDGAAPYTADTNRRSNPGNGWPMANWSYRLEPDGAGRVRCAGDVRTGPPRVCENIGDGGDGTIKNVTIRVNADDGHRAYIDGNPVPLGTDTDWRRIEEYTVPLATGCHILALEVSDLYDVAAGVQATISQDGGVTYSTSDLAEWRMLSQTITNPSPPGGFPEFTQPADQGTANWKGDGYDDSFWITPVKCSSPVWGSNALTDEGGAWVWFESGCRVAEAATVRLIFFVEP